MNKTYYFVLAFILLASLSWTKENYLMKSAEDCDIRGMYTGKATSAKGQSAQMTYDFRDNNFAVGLSSPTGSAVTFGGFKNTCDSIYISVCYSGNMSYYLLQGKISEDHTVITGTFQNKVTGEKGIFTINKF
jgi:hypothetical protein